MDKEELRRKIMGFGDSSIRKTYFPQFQERKLDLELFHTLIDRAYDAIFIINVTEGTIKEMNYTACVYYQVSCEDYIGKPYQDLFSNEILISHLQPQNIDSQNVRLNLSISTKGGLLLPVDVSISYKAIANINYAVISMRDITKSLLTQQALEESEHKYKDLFNTTSEAIFIHDATTGAIVDVNETMLKMYKCTKDQIKHLTIEDFSAGYPPFDAEHAAKWLQKASKDGSVLFQWLAKKMNGELFWTEVHLRMSNIIGETHILAAVRNIDDRKLAETKIEEQNKKLKEYNEQLLDTNRQLEIAKEKALESDRLKSAFLANMSHEIRTPMNGILGFANLLNSRDLDEGTRQEYVKIITQSSEQLMTIISDILDISKIEAGQLKITEDAFPVGACLNDVLAIGQIELQKKGKEHLSLATTYKNCSSNQSILSDKNRIIQVLLNLLQNAIKFTEKGSITLACEIDNNKKNITFSVADTGSGIAHENHDLIFKRFSQTRTEYEDVSEGNGLGLAISKGIVSLLGGTIWVESEIDKGAHFKFTIPLKQGEIEFLQLIDHSIIEGTPQTTQQKVMIVDDNDINRLYLEQLLDEYEIAHVSAKDGKDAVQKFRDDSEIGLVLMDIQMPVLNGIDSMKQIHKINSSIPVIAQTSYAMSGDKATFIAKGCADYISKPIQRNHLESILKKHLKS